MSDTERLPPPSVSRTALGHFIRVSCDRDPGLMAAWISSMEDEDLAENVIQLRAKSEQVEARRVGRLALNWGRHVRLIWLAAVGREKLKRKR